MASEKPPISSEKDDWGGKATAKISAKAAQMAEKLEQKAALRETKAEQRAAKLEQKAQKWGQHAEKWADQVHRAEAIEQETYQRLASTLSALDVWTRDAAGRSRRPRFSRDEIAATAMRLADSEGFEAVSMRRLAAELGAGTMTLYHYVQTKDELLTLLTDAVMGEVVIPPDIAIPTDWREAITLVADRSRAAFVRHGWMLDMTDDPPLGPNSVRHFDQTLQAVAPLGGSLGDRVDVVAAVDEYVFGYCLHERNRGPSGAPVFNDAVIHYVNGLIDSGGYPQLQALTSELGIEAAWSEIDANMRDPERFHRNLARLLDGVEADFQRRDRGAAARRVSRSRRPDRR